MQLFSLFRAPMIALTLTAVVGLTVAALFSHFSSVESSTAQSVPRSVQYNASGETMTLTRILASDLSADTGDKACAKLRGSNGLPMICKNNVDSFPYLGNKGCKQFYPWANERVSTYPGHGAHGGNYDLICLAQGTKGASGTCSQISGDTCTTCPQCAKNLDCNEKLSVPSDFSNGVIVRCFDPPTPPPAQTATSGSTSSLSSSLVLKLSFDQQNAQDSSGQNHHGTAQGGVTYSSTGCRSGACAHFDGGNDTIFSNGSFNLPGDMTVATWVKAGSQSVGARVIDVQRGDGVGVNIYFDSGRFVLDNGGGPSSVLPSSAGYDNNQWHHVAAVRSGSSYAFYVDGHFIGTRQGSLPTYTGYNLARWSNNSNYLQGAIDEVYVFNRALNASEIATVKDSGVTAPASTSPSAPALGISRPAVSDSADLDGLKVVKVDAGETGHSACATIGRICGGPSLFNRDACLKMYPHAKIKNAAQGPQTEHFCKGGSTTGVCAGTVDDTCVVAVSSSQQVTCDSSPTNVDAFFVECEIPFAPEIIESTGGVLPAQGDPVVSVNDDGSVQVSFTVTVHSPSDLPTQIRIEWSSDGASWHKATLVDDSVVVSDGTADQNASSQNQIGSVDRVDTDQFDSISVDFVWDSEADRPQGGDVQLRILVIDDQGNSSSDTSQPFSLDVTDEESDGTPADEDTFPAPSQTDEGSVGEEGSPGTDGSGRPGDGSETSEQDASHGAAGGESMSSQRCLNSNGAGETPCSDEQQLIQYLGAIVNEVIDPDTLTEKEKGLAEFIKRFNALKSGEITDPANRLAVFGHDLTRAEAVDIIVFLLLAKSAVVISDEMLDLPYSDVSYESPFAESIAIATAYDIVDGYPDGNFRPDQSPNRAEVARMVVRAATILHNRIQEVYSQEVLKLDEALLTEWFSEYLLTFARFGIILPTSYAELGQSVSGVAFLDSFYELLLAAGVSAPLTAN